MNDLLLIVTIAGQRVAIPAAEVESVVEIEGLTPVPRAPGHVAGLSALRSRVLTVVDCRASLELGRGEPVAGPREAIVVPRDGHPYAFLVDGVEDVLDHSGEVRPVRSALEAGWARVARGMVDAGGDLLLLIDTGALLAGPAAEAA
jgi:purine-binding chemotaxis protein CheW